MKNGMIIRWKHKIVTMPVYDIDSNVITKIGNNDTIQLLQLNLDYDENSIMILHKYGFGYIGKHWIYCGEAVRKARYEFV